jgi:hypothetical protein
MHSGVPWSVLRVAHARRLELSTSHAVPLRQRAAGGQIGEDAAGDHALGEHRCGPVPVAGCTASLLERDPRVHLAVNDLVHQGVQVRHFGAVRQHHDQLGRAVREAPVNSAACITAIDSAPRGAAGPARIGDVGMGREIETVRPPWPAPRGL